MLLLLLLLLPGVEDDGYPRGLDPQELATSISMLSRMAASLQATARLVEYRPGGFGRTAALLHLKENAEEDMRATEIRVAGEEGSLFWISQSALNGRAETTA